MAMAGLVVCVRGRGSCEGLKAIEEAGGGRKVHK